MKPAYLFSGSDSAKIAATRSRLRARAESEGGTAALEVYEPEDGKGAPDAEAVAASIPAMSLVTSRRYVLVDGVERWKDAQARRVVEALAGIPPETTVVLIGHDKVNSKLKGAVEEAGGQVQEFEAPKAGAMPRYLISEATERGFTLSPEAARHLIDRMGTDPMRLANELDRLAIWAGDGGSVEAEDLAGMVADTSETVVWSLADSILERDAGRAIRMGDELLDQGESLGGLVHAIAGRLRRAREALLRLEAGESPKNLEGSMGMHPYGARQLIARVSEREPGELGEATEALADLERWTRGGSEYDERLALTLALRRACGAAPEVERR